MAVTFTFTAQYGYYFKSIAQHGSYFYMHYAAWMLLLHALRSTKVTFTCTAQHGCYCYKLSVAWMLLLDALRSMDIIFRCTVPHGCYF